MALSLTFHGGGGKVTGSNFLVEGDRSSILVDCGIEQGADFSESSAYSPFPYDPMSIHAVVVTHAHLDHIGRLPKLVRDGFRGKIYMTPPTKDLADLILHDSIDILAVEARRHGREPLYEATDVEATLARVQTLSYHEMREIAPGLRATFRQTGHILGSASVRIEDEAGVALGITGDIGNSPTPLLPNWEPLGDVDVLVMESVYGNRAHPDKATRESLMKERLERALKRGGAVLIPAFSIERTQLMLHELSNLFEARDLSQVPVFLDSPLAIAVTDVYEKWGREYFKPIAQDEMRREKSLFNFPFLSKTKSTQESALIAKTSNPKIIIAGAGMSHGGRIGRWEALYLPDPKSTLFIAGYQAPGSPGRLLEEGIKRVRLNGQDVRVRATIEKLEGWSGHADRDGLLEFAKASLENKRVKSIFTALGEPAAEKFLAQRIHDYLGAEAIAPVSGSSWKITKRGVTQLS